MIPIDQAEILGMLLSSYREKVMEDLSDLCKVSVTSNN